MFVHIPGVRKILKCAISFHEWMDSYVAGLFERQNTTLVSTVFSNVTLTQWFLFLSAWQPIQPSPYHRQGDGVALYI